MLRHWVDGYLGGYHGDGDRMNPNCNCPMAGYCERHQIRKGPAQHARCQGTAGGKDCGLSYWQAWESGQLGATAPSDPVFQPVGFCGAAPANVSTIGTALKTIIQRETGIEIPCEQCQATIVELNRLTVRQAEQARGRIVDQIIQRAPAMTAGLWQRIAIAADSLTGAGILRGVVDGWYTEALQAAADAPTKTAKCCGQ